MIRISICTELSLSHNHSYQTTMKLTMSIDIRSKLSWLFCRPKSDEIGILRLTEGFGVLPAGRIWWKWDTFSCLPCSYFSERWRAARWEKIKKTKSQLRQFDWFNFTKSIALQSLAEFSSSQERGNLLSLRCLPRVDFHISGWSSSYLMLHNMVTNYQNN